MYRNDQISLEEIADIAPEKIVIFSLGPCTPDEAGISVALGTVFAGKIPILGVCLGHQSIGQAVWWESCGRADNYARKVSEIYHRGQSIFKGYPIHLLLRATIRCG